MIASEPAFVRRYRDLYHLPVSDPHLRRQCAPRLLAELFLHDVRTGARTADGAPIVVDDHAVPQWDEDTSYLGDTPPSVEMDSRSLERYLMRAADDDDADDLIGRQGALTDMAIDDDQLMAMLDQVGGGSWD